MSLKNSFSVFLIVLNGLLTALNTDAFGQNNLENNGVCLDPIVSHDVYIDPEHTFGFTASSGNVTDGNLSDFGLLQLVKGASVSVRDPYNYYPAGNEFGFIVQPIGGTLDGDVPFYFELKTYRNGQIQESISPIKIRPLSAGSGLFILCATSTKDFDMVKLYYGADPIGGFTALRIYYAYESAPGCCKECTNPDLDSDHDGYADCYDRCPNGNDALDTDGDGQPDSCEMMTTDLSLTKTVSANNAAINENVEFYITVRNDTTFAATGVVVSDLLPAGLRYMSHTAPQGTDYDPTTGRWTVGNALPIKGQLTLRLTARVEAYGLTVNTAEIIAMCEKDLDSTPNNQTEGEDDLTRACVSVPITICPGQSVRLTTPVGMNTYQWFRNGSPIAGATLPYYDASQEGTYTVALNASGNTLAGFSCGIGLTVRPASVCSDCPAVVCVPVTIRRRTP